jgi:hypothetical protein
MINGSGPFFLVCPSLFTYISPSLSLSLSPSSLVLKSFSSNSLREKYRKVPLSLREGASSEMELPVDERIPLHQSLNSPRARSDNYSEMTKTSSTPDLRASRQKLRADDMMMIALSHSTNAPSQTHKNGYGTYQGQIDRLSSCRPVSQSLYSCPNNR